ncbi:MAG TPA: TraR/DksA C4-type zinc finger protein [Planctomycetota bacterium]|nr:TraR/DksA C4-type zinc finger protein [Planctomycetota bacterium]
MAVLSVSPREVLAPEELERFEALLRERRTELLERLGRLERESTSETGEISTLPNHLADLGTDQFEQTLALELRSEEARELREIDEALARLREGTYGRCEDCGRPIARERLEAIPYARQCRNCRLKEEER